jgi:hypothetical protein
MKKIISTLTAFLLTFSALTSESSADLVYKVQSCGILAKPVITVALPKKMSFIFNPYGISLKGTGTIDRTATESKVIPDYIESNENGWTVKNTSDVPVRMGIYAHCSATSNPDFSVRDASVNTVDASDDTKKYLFLDIKASGGSSGTQNVTLLDEMLKTDEADNSKKVDFSAGWWSDENEDTITVIHDIPKNGGTANVSMTGTTQNLGDLAWSKFDKATVFFVFSFEAEPTTGC